MGGKRSLRHSGAGAGPWAHFTSCWEVPIGPGCPTRAIHISWGLTTMFSPFPSAVVLQSPYKLPFLLKDCLQFCFDITIQALPALDCACDVSWTKGIPLGSEWCCCVLSAGDALLQSLHPRRQSHSYACGPLAAVLRDSHYFIKNETFV